MSASAIIAIAIVAVVLLAAIAVRHRRAPRATPGAAPASLSRETRKRDRQRAARAGEAARPARSSRRPRERRPSRRTSWCRSATELPGPVRAARPRAARRHPPPVPQPRRRHAHGRRPRPASAPPCIAFLWPKLGGGFGSKITVGKVDDVLAEIQGQRRLLLPRRGPARGSPSYPADGARRRPRRSTRRRCSTGMEAGLVVALPEVPAPRLPRAVLRHLAVVRVPVPRLAVQPGR